MKLKIIGFCVTVLFWEPAWAQTSLIDAVLQSQQSLVTVRSLRTEIHPSSPVSAKAMTMEKIGAGVIIDPEGFIVTNYHTIKYAEQLGVRLADGTSVGGQIVHMLPEHDLALIHVTPPFPLTPVVFADSDDVKLGDYVVNVGHSFYLNQTISGGKVIGLGRMKGNQNSGAVELIKINIDLYQGDSGGPLLDRHGRLIGMIAAELKSEKKATFAIPSNKIKKLYFDFKKKEYNRLN